MNRKLGRRPRIYSPLVPHLSAFLGALDQLPVPSPAIDYLAKCNQQFGMMLNDTLGDCVIAMLYHARQIWTANASPLELTEPDAEVLATYEAFCGYNARNPNTDQGCVEQQVLADWVVKGLPILEKSSKARGKARPHPHPHPWPPHHPPGPGPGPGPGPAGNVDKLLAFVEVDPRNDLDMQIAIEQCGCLLTGFNVPAFIVPPHQPSPLFWDLDPTGNQAIVGGHAVCMGGYTQADPAHGNLPTYKLISWGAEYTVSKAFKDTYFDEAYAPCDSAWIQNTGQTILGLTAVQLEGLMGGIKKIKHLVA